MPRPFWMSAEYAQLGGGGGGVEEEGGFFYLLSLQEGLIAHLEVLFSHLLGRMGKAMSICTLR